ncbi:MAG: heavy-metal-associated domain-containing protein [Burkholderiaceae bacterium]|nr:heavy-metal-associated domain-containing protein [Burkholderiaceae bacterium]
MKSTEFRVQGMTCGGCEQSVIRTISALAEVASVRVDRGQEKAVVTWKDSITSDGQARASKSVCEAVEAAGFECAPA